MKTKEMYNRLSRLLLVVCTWLFPLTLFAQLISGRVLDKESSEVLQYANIVVLAVDDSSYQAGTVTNENGYFFLDKPVQKCFLEVRYLGYETLMLDINSNDIGDIYLSTRSNMLSEVVVKAAAKTFRIESDGITADIQNSRLKDMGNLPEVLGQLPFVHKVQDSYTVIGRGSPVLYINNRLVRNNNELHEINSKDIKKVTVITDPGAEYDASVSAVIKIETIRPAGEGFSGDVMTYNRYNSKFSTLNRLSLNYRKTNLDVFTGLQYADMDFPKDRLVTNTIQSTGNNALVESYSRQNDGFNHLIPKAGFNYIINESHSFGSQYEYMRYGLFGRGDTDIDVFGDNIFEEKLHSTYDMDALQHSHYINAYYNGKPLSWLNFKLDMDFKTNKGKNHTKNRNTLEDNSMEHILTREDTHYNLYAGKLTFTSPFRGNNLSYGVETSYTTNKQNFVVEENPNIPGIESSGNYTRQNLYAGFVSYSRTFGKFSANVGARYENIRFKYYQNEVYMDEQSKTYHKLFPSARISYTNEAIQMQLAYRQSVRRPSYLELRGRVFYFAPYSYSGGNPALQPTYQNNFSYTLMWKDFMLMGTYSIYKNHIIEIPELYMANSIIMRPVNIDKKQMVFVANYTPTIGIWKPNLEVSITKDYLRFASSFLKYNDPVLAVNFRNNIRIGGWQLGLDIYAKTKGHRNAEYNTQSWNMAAYINKSFFDQQLMLNVRANDIFNTTNDLVDYRFGTYSSVYDNSMYRRNITIQLTYRFNAVRNRYRGSRATDELDRL